jgi:hypothetical protein
MSGWVLMRHAATGGAALYTDDPALLTLLESRGWVRDELPDGIDPDDPYAPAALAEVLAEIAAEPEKQPAKPEKKTSKAAASATTKEE